MSNVTSSVSIDLASIPALLDIANKANITVNLVGMQGIGKSEIVRQYAKEYGFDAVVDIRLGQMEISDLIGLPTIVMKNKVPYTYWGVPSWFPEEGKKTVLFFDEWNRAATVDVIQAVFQVFLDKRIHTHVLPKDCQVIIAMNPPDSKFMVNKIKDVALSSRLLHLNVEPTREEWLTWARKNKIDQTIIDFIHTTPAALGDVKFKGIGKTPDNRSWEFVHRVKSNCSEEEWAKWGIILVAGLIGLEMAIPYVKFVEDNTYKPLQAKDILNYLPKFMDKLLVWTNPENVRMDVLKATVENVETYLTTAKKDKFTAKNMENYTKFVDMLPSDLLSAHIGALTMAGCDPDLYCHIVNELIEKNPGIKTKIKGSIKIDEQTTA